MPTMTAVSLCRTKAPADCSLWSRQARLRERYYADVSVCDAPLKEILEADTYFLLVSYR